MNTGTMVGVIALAGLCWLTPVAARADGAVSPNKYTSGASQSVSIDSSTSVTLSIDLTIGKRFKKHKMVIVHGSLGTQNGNASTATIKLTAYINGIEMEPSSALTHAPAFARFHLSSTWWLDLDSAELANPGIFFNTSPLTVTLEGVATESIHGPMSMVATVVKK